MNTSLQNISAGDKYIVRNPNNHISQVSKPYLLFDIRPNLLPVKAIAKKDSCSGLHKVFHGQNVGIEGYWQMFSGSLQVRCSSIVELNRETQKISQAKVRLRAMLSWLPNNNLREFVMKVFHDENIIHDFSSAPASLNHHHAYSGGLLVHSVDTAWQVFNNHQIASNVRHLGTVLGLLHDIGKIRTLSSDMTRTNLGKFVDHEKLSLEILAKQLHWLDGVDSELAIAIRYLFTWEKKSYDPIPKLDVYDIIKTADRISSSSSTTGH